MMKKKPSNFKQSCNAEFSIAAIILIVSLLIAVIIGAIVLFAFSQGAETGVLHNNESTAVSGTPSDLWIPLDSPLDTSGPYHVYIHGGP